LADYRDHYDEIRATGADVVAISVDRPEQSERLRRELGLPFAILSDADRFAVKEWDILNRRKHGGIAKPSVFVIATGRNVLFSSVDSVRSRIGASEVARMLRPCIRTPRASPRIHAALQRHHARPAQHVQPLRA
jgi:peroxiredoxin